ncbi:hypothetical protein ACCUM_4268 [Candidatus Accumulibacter phosphatis]|uniref:Uncharacterized protein n=1 Tax=Candidatus Accumulibacter phosphatis TaxID=327160 RepID=A0A5S4F6X9_9PROT|nr:hypothetical protein ACCUM_4268 [Candidatus Accumulibacter phosphatis]
MPQVRRCRKSLQKNHSDMAREHSCSRTAGRQPSPEDGSAATRPPQACHGVPRDRFPIDGGRPERPYSCPHHQRFSRCRRTAPDRGPAVVLHLSPTSTIAAGVAALPVPQPEPRSVVLHGKACP